MDASGGAHGGEVQAWVGGLWSETAGISGVRSPVLCFKWSKKNHDIITVVIMVNYEA
jgi:hypothetical protein